MLQLTPELLEKLKKDYWYIFNEYQRKEALLLARELEQEARSLEASNLELFKKYQNFIAQLKWVAFPLIQKDFDMMSLIQNHLLEGLKNEDLDMIKIVTDRGELLFENGTREFLSQLLSATRANQQEIGSDPIMIKGETNLVRPSVKNWLLDYLRNSTVKNPAQIDESNYLFRNSNAKKLKENDKKILGKLLAFYDNFKYVADQIAMDEMRQMMPQEPTEIKQPPMVVSPSQPPAPPAYRPAHSTRPIQPVPSSPYLEPIEKKLPVQPAPRYAPAQQPKIPPSQAIKDYYNQLASQPTAPKPTHPTSPPSSFVKTSEDKPLQPPPQQAPRPAPFNPLSRTPQPPMPAKNYGEPKKDSYLEPIGNEPKRPASQRPPDDRIMGNIVDLKNLDK